MSKYHLTILDNETGEKIRDLDVTGAMVSYGVDKEDEHFCGSLHVTENSTLADFMLSITCLKMLNDLRFADTDLGNLWAHLKDSPNCVEAFFRECAEEQTFCEEVAIDV